MQKGMKRDYYNIDLEYSEYLLQESFSDNNDKDSLQKHSDFDEYYQNE